MQRLAVDVLSLYGQSVIILHGLGSCQIVVVIIIIIIIIITNCGRDSRPS